MPIPTSCTAFCTRSFAIRTGTDCSSVWEAAIETSEAIVRMTKTAIPTWPASSHRSKHHDEVAKAVSHT
jgi:hypothetical protein